MQECINNIHSPLMALMWKMRCQKGKISTDKSTLALISPNGWNLGNTTDYLKWTGLYQEAGSPGSWSFRSVCANSVFNAAGKRSNSSCFVISKSSAEDRSEHWLSHEKWIVVSLFQSMWLDVRYWCYNLHMLCSYSWTHDQSLSSQSKLMISILVQDFVY